MHDKNSKLDTIISAVSCSYDLCGALAHPPPSLDFEVGWTGELE